MSRIAENLEPGPYGCIPGFTENTTSKAAATSVRLGCAGARAELFRLMARNPGTADEFAAMLGWSILYVRPRIAEMRKLGQIVDSGDRRENDSGRAAIVWRVNV